jgi:hypothetical protein
VVRLAGRLSEYRALLRGASDWEPLLLSHSGLPGPRANLELARVAADEASPDQLREWAASGEEYLALVGTMGLDDLDALHVQANDPRWRVREGAAMALQRLGFDAVLPAMRAWSSGTLLERRAVVGGLCEPALLDSSRAVVVLGSVAVAAAPARGRDVMGRWLDSDDRDVAWVMRENLKKKRLAGVF